MHDIAASLQAVLLGRRLDRRLVLGRGFLEMARDVLNGAPQATAFIWSWCGELGNEETDVQRYPDLMSRLEGEYAEVRLVASFRGGSGFASVC